MESHIVKILEKDDVTHNVKRFLIEKPHGYTFKPGQATDVAINQSGLEKELRPFTFTSQPTDDHLEFIIKIYKGHDGITERLANLNEGDELIIHEVFGAITYKGPGLFIAGGAGITPFISILRHLSLNHQLARHTLLFANHSGKDIILKDELTMMLAADFVNVLSVAANSDTSGQQIDQPFLAQYLREPGAFYYICGPDQFILDIMSYLKNLGIAESNLIIEQ